MIKIKKNVSSIVKNHPPTHADIKCVLDIPLQSSVRTKHTNSKCSADETPHAITIQTKHLISHPGVAFDLYATSNYLIVHTHTHTQRRAEEARSIAKQTNHLSPTELYKRSLTAGSDSMKTTAADGGVKMVKGDWPTIWVLKWICEGDEIQSSHCVKRLLTDG